MTDPRFFDAAVPMKVGGVEYQASMFGDQNYADLVMYAQSKFVALAVSASKELSSEDKKILIGEALKQATGITYDSPECQNAIWSKDGVVQIGYQLVRKRQPRITFDEFKREFIKNVGESIDAVLMAFQQLHFSTEDAGGSSTENSKS